MQLKSASFKKYRLLKDCTIKFSVNTKRPLTVIRGENGFGKTTILDALRWAFYGNDVLAPTYKLTDQSDISKNPAVVEVEVIFSHYRLNQKAGGTQSLDDVDYRLVRTVRETPTQNDRADRAKDNLSLFEKNKGRWELLEAGAELILRRMLPLTVKDIFFLDGDKALTFVEAGDVGLRRERTRLAATEMLDIELIDTASRRVREAIGELSAQDRGADKDETAYRDALTKRERNQSSLSGLQDKLSKAEENEKALENEYERLDGELTDALRKGDRTELARRLEDVKRGRKDAETEISVAHTSLSAALNAENLAVSLLAGSLTKAKEQLKPLDSPETVPANLAAVLRERLDLGECICGTSLSKGSGHRKHIEDLLRAQADSSEEDRQLFQLHVRATTLSRGNPGNAWKEEVVSRIKSAERALDRLDVLQREQADLEERIKALRDSNVDSIRTKRDRAHNAQLKRASEARDLRLEATRLGREIHELDREIARLETRVAKDSTLKGQVTAANDLLALLEAAKDSVLTKQIDEISESLNKEFLGMVGMRAEGETAITRSELTKEFELKVYSQAGTLDTSDAISGAQKRALCFAFNQALIEASGVSAPNVIDTPLGMTSGPVKPAILKRIIRKSPQPILFLTPSEIKNCESIINETAGEQATVTNTGSGIVAHRQSGPVRILVCSCDISSSCKICKIVPEIKDDSD